MVLFLDLDIDFSFNLLDVTRKIPIFAAKETLTL
jgi:hypothetical protein